jgi:mRNA interferase MazF
MISSQLHYYVADFDELVQGSDADFAESGLKVPSVIRVGRLAVVADVILLGAIGQISRDRLERIKKRLAEWLAKD